MHYDLIEELVALGTKQHKPEAVTVRVEIRRPIELSESDIRWCGIELAKTVYPTMKFGHALHVELIDRNELGEWYDVAVEVK